MSKLATLVGAWAVMALIVGNAMALELEIDVAPKTLVLKSRGGQFTVHTNVPFDPDVSVSLAVDGAAVNVGTFADDCGNLVAQCSKDAVKEAVGDFDGRATTASATLTVEGFGSATEEFAVRK